MIRLQLSAKQDKIVHLPLTAKVFLEGPAGTGKTTAGVERMLYLMQAGVPGNTILVLVPQRILGTPYIDAMNTPGVVAGGIVSVVTLSGLAQHMVDLFWPLVAEPAGFARPDEPPVFVNLEAAQYFMAHLVRPLLGQGTFGSLTIDRNRLYSQILDNLNKAAVVGFSFLEIGQRLRAAWSGEPGQSRVYDDAQQCAALFREYCLQHNLLDFSLQIEIFWKYIWKTELCREYLQNTYCHLIVDNTEEDVPLTHDLLAEWIALSESCLVIADSQAGYRRFLGADPVDAYRLKESCEQSITFGDSYVQSEEIQALSKHLNQILARKPLPVLKTDPRPAIMHETHTYYPQMLDWITGQIKLLIDDEGFQPQNIVVLAPFLSDSLRFSVARRLTDRGIPVKTHRPSRSLREEPATFCLMTLVRAGSSGLGSDPVQIRCRPQLYAGDRRDGPDQGENPDRYRVPGTGWQLYAFAIRADHTGHPGTYLIRPRREIRATEIMAG